MATKTFRVITLLNKINERNRESTCNPDVREGMNSILEDILHSTGNYEGFSYLDQREVPSGHLPGIIFDESEERNHQFPDDTRRTYFTSGKIAS